MDSAVQPRLDSSRPWLPPDVQVTSRAPEPITDPTLGIPLKPASARRDEPVHRLVVIGDSLGHGFQSGAVTNTDVSFPAIIAYELGWFERFRRPHYHAFGGLPFNIENFARYLERTFPDGLSWRNIGAAGVAVHRYLSAAKAWWERGPGSRFRPAEGPLHNLAIFGWDLRDVLDRDADECRERILDGRRGSHPLFVEHANERAAIRVLDSARDRHGHALTAPHAARWLGDHGGIETLIVFVGANNVLKTVTHLSLVWSGRDYDHLHRKEAYTIWRPLHFRLELRRLAHQIAAVDARHVIWATVPHVTILPVARGVGGKAHKGSRYFRYYTRPWITDDEFDPSIHPHLTADDARIIDSTIDQYNAAIADVVREAREAGLDWLLCDVAGMMDRMALRRYWEDPDARPRWWRPLHLPSRLRTLDPQLDSRFFTADVRGRTAGGLISLDGIHPTTVGYGVLAQPFIDVMRGAGVTFFQRDGRMPREGGVHVDFDRLLARDSLVADPPRRLDADMDLLGRIEEMMGFVRRALRMDVFR